jgi:hypothetical protein
VAKMGLTPDPTKLTPEQRDKLESYQQAQDQLQVLSDIAMMVQELINVADDSKKNTDQLKDLGAVLIDSREQLMALNKKEAPETPDFAKPVVEALKTLEKALKGLDVKPQVNVEAPSVSVQAPDVDLTEINKILSREIPKAFKEAISLIPKVEIPKTDNSELLKAWEGISEQLVSLENATRLKPLPGSMSISNRVSTNNHGYDGENWGQMPLPLIDQPFDYISFTDDDGLGNYQTWTFKTGGSSGITVRTLAVTYDASSNITSIERS